ncbi:hypothetical protein [Timonella senegalensis]|uniref:hypothetical protein n=1 Tax=Timonella senegalensis TaxID=1465825 RepID=UPI0005926D76|nr:hypothetical protein [Timonella senegalensis]
MIDQEIDELVRLGQRGFLLEGRKEGLTFLFAVGISPASRSTRRWRFIHKDNAASFYDAAIIDLVGIPQVHPISAEVSSWAESMMADYFTCDSPLSLEHICEFLELDSARWVTRSNEVTTLLSSNQNISPMDRAWIEECYRGDYVVAGVAAREYQDELRLAIAIADVSQPSPGWAWRPRGIPLRNFDNMTMSLAFYVFYSKASFVPSEDPHAWDQLQREAKKVPQESRTVWLERLSASFDIIPAGIIEEIPLR